MQPLDFYTAQDIFSDPGPFAPRYETLSTDLTALHRQINQLVLHIWRAKREYPDQFLTRPHDVWTYRLEKVFARSVELDPRPFDQPRPPARRAVVDCRTFSLLLCSILRQRGIPARPRCGFATYLTSGFWMDQCVCEYWDAKLGRWIMEDADVQLHRVPSARFYTGLRAWELTRKMPPMGSNFGFGPNDRGDYAARCNAVRDFAALNGFASVSADSWGLGNKPKEELTAEDLAMLDEMVRLSDGNNTYTQRVDLYDNCVGLKPGRFIRHFDYLVNLVPEDVDLEEALKL